MNMHIDRFNAAMSRVYIYFDIPSDQYVDKPILQQKFSDKLAEMGFILSPEKVTSTLIRLRKSGKLSKIRR